MFSRASIAIARGPCHRASCGTRYVRSTPISAARAPGWSTMPNGIVPGCGSERRSPKEPQTSWSTGGWPSHSRCGGLDAVPTCCCRSGLPSTTARLVLGMASYLNRCPIHTRHWRRRRNPPNLWTVPTLPGRGLETLGNLLGSPRDRRLTDPGVEGLRGVDPEHVALARPAQRHLDLAPPVDAVRRHPGKRHPGRNGAPHHLPGQPWLGGEAHLGRHMRRLQPSRVVGPALGQVEGAVDEGVPVP